MAKATDVVLVGHSAGGMAVLLNLGLWRRSIPQHVPLYAIMDGGVPEKQEGRLGLASAR